MVVLVVFAAYGLISQLADIGFDTIVDEISNAEWAWVAIAFILAQLTTVGDSYSLTGIVQNRVPFGPTIMYQYALKFISLAVPADAGAIAMNIRYMQKLGESTPAAVAQGPLLTIFAKGIDIILLIIASQVIGRTVALDDIDSGPVLRLLVLIVVIIAVGVVAVLAVPKLRAKVIPPIKERMSRSLLKSLRGGGPGCHAAIEFWSVLRVGVTALA